MIPTLPFGSTGHRSSRLIFGAAALARVDQATADAALERLLALGVNHIDTAASYGDSELRLAAGLSRHRERFFLASKTGDRAYAEARDSIRRSLERLGVDRIDLIQLHNLVKEDEWERALGDDGALRAAVEARDEGLVRFIGVTGHGTRVARMHLRSLARFPFDSVLLPYSRILMRDPVYADDFAELLDLCRERGVAVQTIKAVARRRWPEGVEPDHTTWYQPLTDPDEIAREVAWVLANPDVFLNSASDLRLLWSTAEAVERDAGDPAEPAATADDASDPADFEPIFLRGYGGATA